MLILIGKAIKEKFTRMRSTDNEFSMLDAFVALRDVDDAAVKGMIKPKATSKKISEGKEFSLHASGKDLEKAKEFITEQEEDALEVIDIDADSLEHVKDRIDYVGQVILRCNRCKANRFIDMDKLVQSEDDEETYNIDDECPNCKTSGAGYEIIGQVGKVEKDEPEAESDASEEEVAVENDEKDPDDAVFSNDVEPESDETDVDAEDADASTESSEEDVVKEIESDDEPEEKDMMETDTSEDDDLPDIDLLGDEVDVDDELQADEDEEDDVKESLNESIEVNAYAKEAFLMGKVIESMNDEEAYYGSNWLYTWPDGDIENEEDAAIYFSDKESFDELKDLFLDVYSDVTYHEGGLYRPDEETVAYAHKIDKLLGLRPIDVVGELHESFDGALNNATVAEVLGSILSCDKIGKIIVLNVDDNDNEHEVFSGNYCDLPLSIAGSNCTSFDTANGVMSCNIDTDDCHRYRTVADMLSKFGDEDTDKICLFDLESGEGVFDGKKADAIEKFGNCGFVSVDAPSVIRLKICDPAILSSKEVEDDKSDADKLVENILKANELSIHRLNKTTTNEFWINHSINNREDLELIYETFVKPCGDKELIKEFKSVTGYTNALEEAFEAGYAAAAKEAEKQTAAEMRKEEVPADISSDEEPKGEKQALTESVNCIIGVKNDGSRQYYSVEEGWVDDPYKATTWEDLDEAREIWDQLDKRAFRRVFVPVYDPEAWTSNECINEGMSRDAMIAEMRSFCKNYRFERFSDAQIFRMLEKERAAAKKKSAEPKEEPAAKCENCGGRLNDSGTCPKCDHGDEEVNEGLLTWICMFNDKEVGKVEAEDHDSALEKMQKEYPDLNYGESDGCFDVYPESELAEALDEDEWEDEDVETSEPEYLPFDELKAIFDGEVEVAVEEWGLDSKGIMNHFLTIFAEADMNQPNPDELKKLIDEYLSKKADTEEIGESVRSFKNRKELSEAILECKNNNRPYTIRRSKQEGFRYDLVERLNLAAPEDENLPVESDAISGEVLPAETETAVAERSQITDEVVAKIMRISKDISDAIKDIWGIDADPRLIVADMLQDLRLIGREISVSDLADTPANQITAQMYQDHEAAYEFLNDLVSRIVGRPLEMTPEAKLARAIKTLDNPNFSRELIRKGIGSTSFAMLVGQGRCPFIPQHTQRRYLESDDSVEVDTDKFDREINEYFDSAYEDTVLYTTTSGVVNEDGSIVLEGVVTMNEQMSDITYTLTPDKELNESLTCSKSKSFLESTTFTVKNNLSEEVFTFSFND